MERRILGKRTPIDPRNSEVRTSSPDLGYESLDVTCARFAAQMPDSVFTEPDPQEEADLEKQAKILMDQPSKAAEILSAKITDMVERLIYVDTRPFQFIASERGVTYNRNYLRPLYDFCKKYPIGCRNQIWYTGRQVEKSTTQSAKAIVLGVMFPSYKSLYVAPRGEQVNTFSSQRFKPMVEDSPVMMDKYVRTSKGLWKVTSKEFLNRSFYNFRSCYISADGCRGISAHHLMIDEIQDILSDNIPVIEECQSHYGWETGLRVRSYAGTPKTNSNTITQRYNRSSQFEWMIPCRSCSNWNYPDEKIIGLTCYICTKCGKEIFPQQDGHWEPLNREALDRCWGFRIPQIIVPFKTHADIRQKLDDPQISRLRFNNECLGLPYDEGEVVLTSNDIRAACISGESMLTPEQLGVLSRNGYPMFGGLDHGTGEGDNPSYTVLTIGHFERDVFKVRYMKKFVGQEANLAKQPAVINSICSTAGVRLLMADWGFGAHQNARLVAEYGWSWVNSERVLAQAMYVRQKDKIHYDAKSNKYHVDRNTSMSDCIDAIKRKFIQFFRQEEFDAFQQDFLSIYMEYNETHGTVKYDHIDPDDSFHSVNYAFMAGQLFYGRLNPTMASALHDIDPEDLGY